MTCDSSRHHRRSIRLPGYDYTQPGGYFVTLSTHDRACLFDDPALRRVAEALWQQIPCHFDHVSLDAWVVMPNHLHGVIVIVGRGEAFQSTTLANSRGLSDPTPAVMTALPKNASPLQAGSLGAIVGNFKSVTARRINSIRHMPGAPVWQRNYYEHVVRDEAELFRIRRYIADNPACWAEDEENPLR